MLTRRYDLHCHSNQSDGILSPEALVSRAKAKHVDVLALTDHDTIAGVMRARAQAELEDLELVNGIEFSCLWAGRNIHIVGLAFDPDNPDLVQAVEEQAKARQTRAREIATKLEKHGFEDIYDAAAELAAGGSIGRPHFAQAMVEKGHVRSIDQAFKRYLGAGKPGDVKQHWPEIGDVIDIIREAGGIAVLAHPLKYKITRTKLIKLVEDFVDCGGGAIEVVSGFQKMQETSDMVRIAKKYGLLASCGSDFHAPGGQWAELGQMADMPKDVAPVWQHWETEKLAVES